MLNSRWEVRWTSNKCLYDMSVGAGCESRRRSRKRWPTLQFEAAWPRKELHVFEYKKKCLALVLGIKNFEVHCTSISSRQAIHFANRSQGHEVVAAVQREEHSPPKVESAVTHVQPFNFTVQHRKGSDNANADALLRFLHFLQKKKGGNVTILNRTYESRRILYMCIFCINRNTVWYVEFIQTLPCSYSALRLDKDIDTLCWVLQGLPPTGQCLFQLWLHVCIRISSIYTPVDSLIPWRICLYVVGM